MHGFDALLCQSMVKVKVDMRGGTGSSILLVCDVARRLPLRLNQQAILLLLARGVPKQVTGSRFALIGSQFGSRLALDLLSVWLRLALGWLSIWLSVGSRLALGLALELALD
jgi:hypothetical protein